MPVSEARVAVGEARRLLSSWLDQPRFLARGDGGADLVVAQGNVRIVVDVKRSADTAAVGAAVEQVKQHVTAYGRHAVPVVAAAFMGDMGKRICADAGVSWFDLSGNADIAAPGLRILIDGKPNRYLRRGRPSSVFAPKSARIARHLLIEPRRVFRQQELARETGLDDGFTSRIVGRLEEDGLIERDKTGAIRVPKPDLLLGVWAAAYDFEKHTIVRGHVTGRSGEERLAAVGAALESSKLRYAATGLAAAWAETGFAGFRLVTLYVASQPTASLLKKIGFREEPTGANVWLVVPNDAGVFDGAKKVGDVVCVHPVQAYLDLLGQPERAKEAAAELRSRTLGWKA